MRKLEKEVKEWRSKKTSDEKLKHSRGKSTPVRSRLPDSLRSTALTGQKDLRGRKSVTPPSMSPRKPRSDGGGRPHSDQGDRVEKTPHDQSSNQPKQTGTPSHNKNVHFSKQAW